MVPLPRRLAALLITLIATVSITGTALGSPRDVINDFLEDGVITVCHSKADYDAAKKEDVQSVYGDFQGAIEDALKNPTLVGTDAKPCPPVNEGKDGSGIGNVAVIAVPVGLCIVALAMVFGGRRRRAAEGDHTDVDGPDPPA